jgi:hypothetical protein
MADGFLGRWAQRKADARQGKPLVEPQPPVKPTVQQPVKTLQPTPPDANATAVAASTQSDASPAAMGTVEAEAPPLTLQDAQALGRDSDFKPFIARGVDPAVRNAAMKKLFADPHYNVMDRLDIYIDDYSQPDPLPLSMLRKMASAQFLKLVDEEPENPAATAPTGESTTATTTDIPTRQPDHAHTDLRLQPDHAPVEPDPGRGTE